MFNRFTERARKAIVYAKEEARRLNHDYIGSEHILLGLIREGEGVAAAVLQQFGLDLQHIRLEVEKLVPSRSQTHNLGDIPFDSFAKTALEATAQEARILGHNYLGTEHMLLGLAKVEEGVAHKVLLNFGINFDKLRAETLNLLGPSIPPVITNDTLLKNLEKQNAVVEELKRRVEELENRVKNLEGL